ncbi:hypothetical protein BRC81_06915 [Halobacteriales archaeon QS_1_68_20]|nr:MAG: hypothetical protein BRC81_06915 [Halobacteriales archaeon QS_1_68_20]
MLVTVTAAIGFPSTATSPVPVIRDLGLAMTLGVIASLVICVTLVPALKITIDGLLRRVGFDRHKAALGRGKYLRRWLLTSVAAARRAAPAVIAVTVLVSAIGRIAFTELDRDASQDVDLEVADWKEDLPGPTGFDAFESAAAERILFEQRFQPEGGGSDPTRSLSHTQFLIRGNVTDPAAMNAITAAEEAARTADESVVLKQGNTVDVVSPLSVMEAAAAANSSFAQTFEAADADGDGVPDQNVERLYDALFAVAPEQASRVIERTDDGQYQSLRLIVPARSPANSNRAETMYGIADSMEEASGLTVTAVGAGTFNDVGLSRLTNGIVTTMLLALAAVLVLLVLVFRLEYNSMLLGVLTALPIVLALGIVFGSMYLADVPLTFETALLISITIGLGIDYNIHVSDRFRQKLDRGADLTTTLTRAVTGTGGALLGSALTSGAAFTLMIISPDPRLQSLGVIVAVALGVSFLLSVFVLPSMLWLWARREDDYEVDSDSVSVSD